MTFADALSDWTDADLACFRLGVELGVLPEGTFHSHKGLLWTDNPLGNGLYEALVALTNARILEQRLEPDNQFRWTWPHA
ncbi:hypothetical protein acdb102_33640 [Acidothermaceae bacterium B102]|nr:hypothetical protein acdb102_33640 [Acidothermaceae bacterium B102]